MLRTGFVLLIGAAVCQAQGPINPQSVLKRRSLERLGLEKQWSTVVPLRPGEERVTRYNLAGDQLFIQTNAGVLHAYDGETGRYQWAARLDQNNVNALPVSVNSNLVFVTSLSTLHALDRRTGLSVWNAPLQTQLNVVATRESVPTTGTICDEETVAVGLRNGKLLAFNIRDHSKDIPPGRSAGTFAWAWQTQGELTSRPLVAPRVVVFGSQDHRVYTAVKAEGGQPSQILARYLTGGPVSAALAPHGNRTVIVPSEDFNLYGIDLFDGQTRWVVPTAGPIDQEPIVSGDDVVAINERGRLMKVDGRSGEVLWDTVNAGHHLLALSPSRVYLTNDYFDLVIVDRASGKVIHSARDSLEAAGLFTREMTLVSPNDQNDRIYMVSPQGLAYCLREAGKLQPTRLRDPKLPPFGTIPPEGFPEANPTVAPPVPAPAEAATPPAEEAAPPEAEPKR